MIKITASACACLALGSTLAGLLVLTAANEPRPPAPRVRACTNGRWIWPPVVVEGRPACVQPVARDRT